MASFSSICKSKKLILFLNSCFLILFFFFLTNSLFFDQPYEPRNIPIHLRSIRILHSTTDGCTAIHNHKDYKSKCEYVKSHVECQSKGYINYLEIFYCTCGKYLTLGYAVLSLWLLVLFYILGNTAAEYFCSSLDSLSKLLKLSPTIAGVTLLSLGNGAPDVFSGIVSFTRSSNGGFGLNGVLGGSFFVSSVVVGIISTLISPQQVSVDKSSFLRDALFFLFSLCFLLLIIITGTISLWVAVSFLSIYFCYVSMVCSMHFHNSKDQDNMKRQIQKQPVVISNEDFMELGVPLLGHMNDEKPYLHQKNSTNDLDGNDHKLSPMFWSHVGKAVSVLELPLYLPRRLTIPVVSEERWSRPFAVISMTLAPILLAAVCDTQMEIKNGSTVSEVTYMTAGLIGIILGNLAYVTTKKSSPPSKCLFPWLAAGFIMSVTWTYIVAEELVSLMVSMGYIIGISPSILGLTILAWGNSFGDLISNVAMAMNGGADGAQIAITGCYAGPMFNTVVGLGMSFVISSWSAYPSSYEIPKDNSLYETLGFLMGGLLWAIVILPRNKMKLDRSLGVGLLAIYLCFLSLRLARALALFKLQGH